jgi:hypothetical protein
LEKRKTLFDNSEEIQKSDPYSNSLCVAQMLANGLALSCGVDNFQFAENETSSC